jgi:phage-related protein
MTLEVFDFPFHTQRTKYPDSSVRMQFGGGYEFAAKPQGPDQRTFVLNFTGMRYITASNGTIDLTSDPKKNYGKLEKFYQDHRTYKPFLYNHPVFGQLTVRFGRPLDGPKGTPGGFGVLEPFEIELREQPY